MRVGKIIVYLDASKKTPKRRQRWRWKAIASNGSNVANSGEAYINRARALELADKYGPADFELFVETSDGLLDQFKREHDE